MDIGEPQRIITVEPLEDPVPHEEPAEDPDGEPTEEPLPAAGSEVCGVAPSTVRRAARPPRSRRDPSGAERQ